MVWLTINYSCTLAYAEQARPTAVGKDLCGDDPH